MTIPLTPSISLSPSSFSGSGQVITASVTLPNRPTYAGHPKITGLTTITPKIVCSRVPTGVFPFFVQVSACETTSNAGKTYRDLDYRWNFGDASGTETMTDHYTGKTVNLNDSQMGPEAGYLYRTPGTYTITLTVSGKDENGTTVTASTTSILTIANYLIFTANATGGTFTLTVNGETTSAIDFDATSTEILAALHALASLDSNNCRMTYQGCPEFFGNLAGTTISISGNFASLTGTNGTPQIRTEKTSSTSSVVTVNDATGWTVEYWDSTYAGGNGASDGTESRPWTGAETGHELDTFAEGGSNRMAYVKRGSTLAFTYLYDATDYSGLRILPYGTGADPIITDGSFTVELAFNNKAVDDVVISGLALNQTIGGAWFGATCGANGSVANPYGRCRYIVFDNVTYTQTTAATGNANFASWQNGTRGLGIQVSDGHCWNCDIDMGRRKGQGILSYLDQWFCFTGGSIVGGLDESGTLSRDHHIYNNFTLHGCFRYINFGDGYDISEGESKAFCINNNIHNDAELGAYYLIDGCNVTGTHNGLDFSNSNNDDFTPLGNFSDCVVQFNRFHVGQVGTQILAVYGSNILSFTARYNDFWNNTGGALSIAAVDMDAHHNRMYNSRCVFSSYNETCYFHHNTIWWPTAGTNACLYFVDSTAFTSAQSWDCDHNTYYAPNNTQPIYNAAAGYVSLATWQGYGNDVSGANTDPLWYTPGSGQFTKDPTVAVNWPAGFTSLESSTDDGGTWESYTDNAALSIGAHLTSYDTIMFRAVTDTTTSNVTITCESDGSSVDIAAEQDSSLLTYAVAATYYAFAAGGQTYIFSTGGE